MKLGLVIVVVVIAGIAAVGVAERDQISDAVQSFSGSENAAPRSFPRPTKTIDADRLAVEYTSNEVSADEEYQGKWIRVTGVVKSIRKDPIGNPVVSLHTRERLRTVDARFSRDTTGLGKLAMGMSIAVLCTGGGVIMGSPQIRNCRVE